MKKITIFIFVLTTFLYLLPPPVLAQESGLTVSPPLLEIEALPPTDLETPIRIRNDADEPVTLQILLKPFTASGEDGEIQFLKDTDAFPGANQKITDHIKVRENSQSITTLTLAPKEEKTLDLYIGIDKNEPHSDYYFAVVFLPVDAMSDTPPEDENATAVQGGIAINVLLSIGPKGDAKGIIEEFSSPRFLYSGPVPFTIRVKNTGSRYITPTGTIIITNMFGQKIGRVNLLATNVLPGTIRFLTSEDALKETLNKKRDEETKGNEKNNNPSVSSTAVWPETFLIGPYTATLRVSLSPEGPELIREYRFFAAPVQLSVGIILLIIFIVIIRNRIKTKLS